MASPLQIIFAGAGEFGSPTLRAILDSQHKLVQVISQPDRPAGRGRKLTPTPIAQLAIDRGLPLLRTANINAEQLPPADVMVVIAFGQKISQSIVNHPRLGSVNLHASRLPKFRGAAPINWAILSGETITGNSIIRLADRMDAGTVLAQSRLTIGDTETAGELHDRLAFDGAPLMLKTLDDLSAGRAVEIPQDESLATHAAKLSRQSATLDFSQPPPNIVRRIHGLTPWPGCHVRLLDAANNEVARLSILRAKVGLTEGDRWRFGEIMSDGLINAQGGGIEVLDVKPEGGRAMPLADYRRGRRWDPGLRVASVV